MNSVMIADSSGLISLANRDDSNHKTAYKLVIKLTGSQLSVIIPSDVYSETLNTLGKKTGHDYAINAAFEISQSQAFVVADANDDLRKKALKLFSKQAESVSFTDCIVMAYADLYKTKTIFGFDEVFSKNGYQRLGFD